MLLHSLLPTPRGNNVAFIILPTPAPRGNNVAMPTLLREAIMLYLMPKGCHSMVLLDLFNAWCGNSCVGQEKISIHALDKKISICFRFSASRAAGFLTFRDRIHALHKKNFDFMRCTRKNYAFQRMRWAFSTLNLKVFRSICY